MKRKIISLLLCLVMALSLIPTVAFGVDEDAGKTMQWDWLEHDRNNTPTPTEADTNGLKYVKVSASDLPRFTTSIAVSAVREHGVTIGVNKGYYLSQYTIRCKDKYNCQTAASGHDTRADLSNTGDAEITLNLSNANFSHSNNSKTYWLLLKFAQDNTQYKVTYDWGDLKGKLAAAVPEDNKGYLVNASVTVLQPSADAIAKAAALGYEFDGWTLNGTVVGQNFAMPKSDVTLIAQWKAKAPTTGNLTIEKTVVGLTDDQLANKVFSFTVTNPDGNPTTVYLPDANNQNQWSTTLTDLPLGTYTVTEDAASAQVNGYNLTTSYKVGDDASNDPINVTVNAGKDTPVTVTNTYEKLPTASDTIDIPVEKVWSDGNANHDNDPVTVKLLKNGEETEYTLTLNKANNWQGSFNNVPADGKYTVSEMDVPGYTASYTQPKITGLSVSKWGNKITPASTPSYDVTGNLLVGKKGGNYFVWTRDTLNETQENDLMAAINDANLQGLGKSLTATNTTFASGESASFDNDAVTINNDKITFAKENVWSLFYCGKLTPSSVTEAIITNTPVVPKTYTVDIPVTKTVSAKVGSTLPQNLPSFTFKAYQDKVVVDTLTLELNENTKVSGAQNQYQGTLKVTIPAASLSDGPVVLTIKELPGIDTKWTYDTKEYTVYVINGREKPELEIKLGNDPVNSITFENVYSYKYTPTPKPTTPAKPVTSVKTGDMGVALYAGLAILSMTGSAGVILRRRKNDK